MKPYYDDGQIAIYHCDARALDELKLDDVHSVVTSPPYNVGTAYDDHFDAMSWRDYWELASDVSNAVSSRIVDGGRVWVNVAPVVQDAHERNKTRVNLLAGWAACLDAAKLSAADTVAWISKRGSGTAWGSWQQPSAPNLRGDWEAVLLYFKTRWERTAPQIMQGWRDGGDDWTSLVSNV